MKKKKILLVLGAVWVALVLGWHIYTNALTGNIECGKAFCNTNWMKFMLSLFLWGIPSWVLFLFSIKRKN